MSKQIRLKNEIYEKWNAEKSKHGYQEKTHSEFAQYLLENIHSNVTEEESKIIEEETEIIEEETEIIEEESKVEEEAPIDSDESNAGNRKIEERIGNLCDENTFSGQESNNWNCPIFSESTLTALEPSQLSSSSSYKEKRPFETNFTLTPVISQKEDIIASTKRKKMSTPKSISKRKLFKVDPTLLPVTDEESANPTIGTADGNSSDMGIDDPFKDLTSDEGSESEEDSDSDETTDDDETAISDDSDDELFLMNTDIENSLQKVVDLMKGLDVDDNEVDFLVKDLDKTKYVTENQLNSSSRNAHNVTREFVDMSICSTVNSCESFIDASVAANIDEVKQKVEVSLSSCFNDCKEVQIELNLIQRERIFVTIEKLKELRGETCGMLLSDGSLCPKSIKFEVGGRGSVKQIKWKCSSNHNGKWNSSEVIAQRHLSPIYLNDLLITSCVLLSGNNWKKIELFCRFLNLSIPTVKVFSRYQNLYVAPNVRLLFGTFRDRIISILSQYSELCLCGDGRNDSPGHCARFCTYVLMEHFTKIIVDLEVLDSRNSKGISVNMERDAVVCLLTRLRHVLEISELTTDASSSVLKAVRELASTYPTLSKIFHSLDIWHKAKSLRKALHKTAKVKGNEELLPWVDSIINHFWHCCQSCCRDLAKLKDAWLGVLHHVCGEHVWCESQCSHGEMVKDDPKIPLKKSSQAMEALRSVVTEPRFMQSLVYCTRFRHTGDIENFNSMLLKYAPKRVAFDYDYYEARMMLAAMDHNVHIFRKAATTRSGELLYRRQYCKRVGHWHAEPVKVPKSYPHIPYLLSHIVQNRVNDRESIDRNFGKRDDDPKLISPTLSMKQPPSLNTLITNKVSRMQKNP